MQKIRAAIRRGELDKSHENIPCSVVVEALREAGHDKLADAITEMKMSHGPENQHANHIDRTEWWLGLVSDEETSFEIGLVIHTW